MRDEQLLAYLKGSCSGRKNRVGGTELERTLHVSGTDLRKLVNQLRRKTHPIASDRTFTPQLPVRSTTPSAS